MFLLDRIRHGYGEDVVLDLPGRIQAQAGERWLVLGPSGSGKTTLLHILAGLLRPTHGEVRLADQNLYALTGAVRDRFRGRKIGIVFQQFYLLPAFTVRENLLLAQYMAGLRQDAGRVAEVLGMLDLTGRECVYPSELSFGQRQRVAIARAIVNRPALLLADEPTSGLDDRRCEQVLDLLRQAAGDTTLVVATHDRRMIDHFDHRISLEERVLQEGRL